MKNKSKSYGYKIFRPLLYIIMRLWFNPTIINKENIPKTGAVILAGNHKNDVDAFLVGMGTKRVVHFLAKKELHDNKIFGWFFRFMGTVPVDRKHKDEKAKEYSLELLKSGEVYGIFPEGTHNKTKDIIMPFKYGAVSFAIKTNTKIIPFAITGEYKFRSKTLKIEYGKPIDVCNMNVIGANEILENEVIKMLKK